MSRTSPADSAEGASVGCAERIEIAGWEGVPLVGDRWANHQRRGHVVLLHGGGQTRHSWATTAQRLADRGWEALAMDARGHGESGWTDTPKGYHHPALIEDLKAVVAHIGEPPVVLGASMGGLTAMVAAGTYPRLLRALVLVDVTPRMERTGVAKITSFMHQGLAGFDTLDEAADSVVAYNPERRRPRNLEGLRKNLRRGADGRWYWHWDPAFMTDPHDHDRGLSEEDRRRAAARICVPTLLVRGLQSDVVSTEGAQDLLDLVPGSRLVDATDAGHMVAGDDNDVFSTEVERFLDGLTSRV